MIALEADPRRERRRISLLLPTRGRVALARRFLDSVAATTAHLEAVEVVAYVDEDDVESRELNHESVRLRRIVSSRVTMGECNSACLRHSSGDIVMLVNDDVVIRTQGWDEHLRACDAEVADGVYLAYVDDGFKHRRMSTFPILSRGTCALLQEPYPVEYGGAFIDYHLLDLFTRLKRLGFDRVRYLPHVVFEHHHYRTGKAAKDATYVGRRRFDDDLVFLTLRDRRQEDAERLASFIRGADVSSIASEPVSVRRPEGPVAALCMLVRTILPDRHLPVGFRIWQFVWYCGRFAVARPWQGLSSVDRA